ncbi:VOC family protein [Streptomyces sp. TRM 70361]|uniref:VOC family protein n=1 Tax=Streptomyces sp. TRM 70361 TaxID=3116553 RepID=UPI002E7BAF61|nr:VOC family protein [Streptomyces sp. TRM 70361]MEE1941246.1 VOC family protein [Streptomyces sp. TRM 70361]
MDGTTPAPQVWPTLRARDARALIRFLADAFGFAETLVMTDGEHVHHAELSWPEGGGIMLGSVRGGAGDSWPLEPGSFGAYVVTADPDALFARAVAAGARVVREPYDTDHGSRDFAVRDPEGNRWQFGTYRGAPRRAPEAAGPAESG